MKSTDVKHYDHIICGGGLVGSLLALYLRRRSYSVAIFESYWDLRKEVISQGRSINLILSRRAIEALQKIGIKYQVLEHASVIKGRAIHPPPVPNNNNNNDILYLPYGIYEHEVSYCIGRNKLNEILLTIAENNNVDLYFRHAIEEADFEKGLYTFVTDNECVEYSGTYLYGVDGANSKVRDFVNRETGGSEETHWFESEYKELFVQAHEDGGYMLDPQSVHLWPRGEYFMMGQPNLNGSFSLTLVMPSEGPLTFNTKDEDKIAKFLEENFPDVYDLIPNAIYQFMENPVGYFGTLFTRPWNFKDKAVLLGDAAHTLLPFFWQSVNFGFNDCVVLDSCIKKYGFERAFEEYSKIQKPNGDAIAKLSILNYDKLANPARILQKQIQVKLAQLFPHNFCPKNRATFYLQHSYSEIMQLMEKNDKILQQLAKEIKDVGQLDVKLAEKLIFGGKGI